jgi:hypothetical protein
MGAPSFAFVCKGWDTTAFELHTLSPIDILVEIRGIPPFAKNAKDGAPVALLQHDFLQSGPNHFRRGILVDRVNATGSGVLYRRQLRT